LIRLTCMIKHKYLPWFAYSTLILIWLYTFYVSVITPPFLGYFTVDENFIADSGVFLWYGATPRCLDWPATPSVLAFFIIFGVQLVYHSITHLGEFTTFIDLFESIDRVAFQYLISRQELLVVGRSVQLLLVGIFILLFIRYLFKKDHSLLNTETRFALSLIVVTSYILWFNAPVLRPEAISASIFIYLLARLLFTDSLSSRQCLFLGILFGIVLAERLLFVFVAPILLAAVYFKAQRTPIHHTIRFFLVTLGVFILLCPFLITDPLVILKSFFGGILAKMQDKPMPTFFNEEFIKAYFMNPINYFIVLASLLGCWVLLKSRSLFHYILVGNWLLFLFMVLRSAKIYDTHVLPAGIFTLFATALGIGYLADKVGKNRSTVLAAVLILPIALHNLFNYVNFQEQSHIESNFAKAYYWINELPEGTRLLVHPELDFYLLKSRESLAWNLEQNRDSLKMIRKLNYIMGNKGEQAIRLETLPFVARSFAFEDERLYEIQYQLLNRYGTESELKKYTYFVLLDNTILASNSVRTEDALVDFDNGKYEYLITDILFENREPFKVFANATHPTAFVYKSQ
jgi:hypothetical protein